MHDSRETIHKDNSIQNSNNFVQTFANKIKVNEQNSSKPTRKGKSGSNQLFIQGLGSALHFPSPYFLDYDTLNV